MAVIYDFSDYHTPRLLRSFSQQAGDVVKNIHDFDRYMNNVGASLCRIQETQRAFSAQLDAYLLKLEASKEFVHKCQAACELRSLERMIKERDQIIREVPKNRSANKGSQLL